MTTAPSSRPPMPPGAGARPPVPPQGGGGALPAPSVDVVKLLQKYLWLLIAAVILGVVCGVGGFEVLKRTSPRYVASVVFQVSPPAQQPGTLDARVDARELELYMATQAQVILLPEVLVQAAQDARLRDEAPGFWADYAKSGTLDYLTASGELAKLTRVRVEPGTTFVRMDVSYRDPRSATGLAKLIREAYQSRQERLENTNMTSRIDTLRRRIADFDQRIAEQTQRRQRIIRDQKIESLNQQSSDTAQSLREVSSDLIDLSTNMTALTESIEQMERTLESSSGAIAYSDQQRAQVEENPLVRDLVSQISLLEQELKTLRNQGIQPEHRTYKLTQYRIDATNQQVAVVREEQLRKAFDAEIDGLRRTLQQLRAQEAEKLTRKEDLTTKSTELQNILNDIAAIDSTLVGLQDQRTEHSRQLDTLEDVRTGNARVQVVQPERLPDRLASPQRLVIYALGTILVPGLVTAFLFARELLDQRVKGPSDVAMIPRAKVLGMVPLAAEDPGNPKHFDTIFRDKPRSVLAESIRQVRTTLVRRMAQANHKSCMVVSGMPGSGATSITTNLALACAGVDMRVLVVDANFRRPGVHRVFGLQESRGLSDVLAGDIALDDAVQQSGVHNLAVLTAGSKEKRVFERLGTGPMASLLAQAGERYDMVLLDVAPAIVAGDGLALAARCDAAVLVVRALGEKRGMVARLRNELSEGRAEFIGVLVNQVRSSAGGYMRRNIRATHEYQVAEPADIPADDTPRRERASKPDKKRRADKPEDPAASAATSPPEDPS